MSSYVIRAQVVLEDQPEIRIHGVVCFVACNLSERPFIDTNALLAHQFDTFAEAKSVMNDLFCSDADESNLLNILPLNREGLNPEPARVIKFEVEGLVSSKPELFAPYGDSDEVKALKAEIEQLKAYRNQPREYTDETLREIWYAAGGRTEHAAHYQGGVVAEISEANLFTLLRGVMR